ncbi:MULTISPECIES: hypothetical protein [unclassified Streptomyces]|nr:MULTISPECIES: hypothetical protein [unclassified Streptomyces]
MTGHHRTPTSPAGDAALGVNAAFRPRAAHLSPTGSVLRGGV